MRNNRSISITLLIVGILYCFLFFQSEGIEGGQDSWKHFIDSKYALKHPSLLLDQWNKPVFTWTTLFICQMGMPAMVIFNLLCVLFSGVLLALALQKKQIDNAWLVIPFLAFCPIVLGNVVSCLTEPLNILLLSIVLYLLITDRYKWAVIIASFLPYVRTEGFVICGAIVLFILYKRQFKLLLWLSIGSIVMDIAGFALTGEPFWIITSNPYLKFEQEGQFDPGSGGLLYYVNQARALFGLPLLILFVLANLWCVWLLIKKRAMTTMPMIVVVLLIFWFYFGAHTMIYYLGILGSHGLVRVMAVIGPCMAVGALYAFNNILRLMPESGLTKWILPCFITLAVMHVGYKENKYAKPYHPTEATVKKDKTLTNFEAAKTWIIANNLQSRTIIHQLPAFNVWLDKDPYDVKSSYYIWSINKPDDWAAKGVIVVWDGFYSTREGNMPLDWLMTNPNYKLLHSIEGYEKPADNPTIYDVRIFEKIN